MNLLNKLRFGRLLKRLVQDPTRLDEVHGLTDSLLRDPNAVELLRANFTKPEVAAAYAASVRTPDFSFAALAECAPGTLGAAALLFFTAHNLDPGALARRAPRSDVEWLTAHLYETHDLWHVLTGFSTDVAGELGLQAFYSSQVEGALPSVLLSAGFLNTALHTPREQKRRLDAVARGVALGRDSANLVGVDLAPLLHRPLHEVRRALRLHVDPEHDAIAVHLTSPPAPARQLYDTP